MSRHHVNAADLALTAARVRLLAEQLSDAGRDALVHEWGELLEELESARSAGAAELLLVEYRAGIEERLAGGAR